MELCELITSLSRPEAYPTPPAAVEVRQTHISAVFLAGDVVYKIKKPLDLGFLDFRTLAKRKHFCGEEVRLNRRLAPRVYLGVVPITVEGGRVRVEGSGEPVEWAVKMRRLPDDATLQTRLLRGEIDEGIIKSVARRIAAFHQSADTSERIASFGRFDTVARNARENFTQAEAQVGVTVHREVFERVRTLTENALAQHRPLIESRA